MLLEILAGYQNVVQVDEDARHIPKDTVHKPLECLGRVFQAERHPEELKESKWGHDRRLLNVVLRHRDLMIPAYQIQHRKELRAMGDGGKGVDVRQRVTVVSSRQIQFAIITARAPTTICFRHNVKWRRPRGARGADDAHVRHLLELGLGNIQLLAKELSCPSKNRRATSGNCVVNSVFGWDRGVVRGGGRGNGRESSEDLLDCFQGSGEAEAAETADKLCWLGGNDKGRRRRVTGLILD